MFLNNDLTTKEWDTNSDHEEDIFSNDEVKSNKEEESLNNDETNTNKEEQSLRNDEFDLFDDNM